MQTSLANVPINSIWRTKSYVSKTVSKKEPSPTVIDCPWDTIRMVP